jgi:hypothetical protein
VGTIRLEARNGKEFEGTNPIQKSNARTRSSRNQKDCSASAWDKVALERFHVVFNKPEYTELQGFNYMINDTSRHLQKAKSVMMVFHLFAVLIVGYFEILQSLEDAKNLDFVRLDKKSCLAAAGIVIMI